MRSSSNSSSTLSGMPTLRLDREGAPPQPANLGAERLGFVVTVVIVRRDVAAGRGELAGDGAADSAAGAGHQRDFSA